MSMNFSFDFLRSGPKPPRPEPESPFRILVVGDFSGRGNRAQIEPVDTRKTPKVDIDNVESLMVEWKTRLGLRVGTEQAFAIGFQELEHFHPDQLFKRVELFQGLRDLRARLCNSRTSALAAAEVRGWGSGKAASAVEPKPMDAPATPKSEFESLLGGTAGNVPSAAESHVQAMIRDLIRPHIVPSAQPDLPELTAMVDRTIAEQMRGVLHDPDFQRLEAHWRALHMLVTGLETGDEMQLCALDASRAELEHDVFENSARGLHALLAERPRSTPGGQPWSVVCVLERFAATADDARLLAGLAVCAHAAGAVLLAGAHDSLAGTDSIAQHPKPEQWSQPMSGDAAQAWSVVKSLPEASNVGLAMPRVLGRLPYGPRTEPVDSFEFEECRTQPAACDHESLLWLNPAAHATLLLGRAFTDDGWSLDPNQGGDVDGLPVFIAEIDGEKSAKPCAEVWLTDVTAEALLNAGLITVMSVQHRDAVRVPRLCAINAGPLRPAWA